MNKENNQKLMGRLKREEPDEWRLRQIRSVADSGERLKIRLTNDFAFKKVFRNKVALTGLLSALLEIPADEIKELSFPNTVMTAEYEEEHGGILDVLVVLNNEKRINVEVQVLYFPGWEERTLFYLSRMYVEGFVKGKNYLEMDACIHISILGFDLDPTDRFYTTVGLVNQENGRLYSDKISLRMLYLNKIDEASEEEKKSDVYRWARMISSEDWEVLREMAEYDKYMDAAVDEMERINADRELRYQYLKEEMAVSDEVTIRNAYIRSGKAEGKAESIIDLLEDLGDVPETLSDRILSERDGEILKKWLKYAAKAETVEEFLHKAELK